MDALIEHIAQRLLTHQNCTVFENRLGPVFPSNRKAAQKRIEAIHAFAKEQGWVASVTDPGIRVTFRKAAPSQGK